MGDMPVCVVLGFQPGPGVCQTGILSAELHLWSCGQYLVTLFILSF